MYRPYTQNDLTLVRCPTQGQVNLSTKLQRHSGKLAKAKNGQPNLTIITQEVNHINWANTYPLQPKCTYHCRWTPHSCRPTTPSQPWQTHQHPLERTPHHINQPTFLTLQLSSSCTASLPVLSKLGSHGPACL